MIVPILKGTILAGKINWDDEEKLRMHLASFMDEAKVEVIIRKARSKRTVKQNNYYFGVVLKIIAEESGSWDEKKYTTNDLHAFFRSEFLSRRVDIFGKMRTIIRSTTDLNTKEFTEYIRQIKMFAASTLDIFIPDSDSVTLPDFF